MAELVTSRMGGRNGRAQWLVLVGGLVLLGAALLVSGRAAPAQARFAPVVNGVPRPDHIVVVMEENHSYSAIIGVPAAPYINSLAQQGALMTNSYGVEHPSQPNYLDLFSGSNEGVLDDSCPHTFSTANLGSELIAAGQTFTGYSEDLPAPGSLACTSGAYARKHSPWINFTNVPASANLPLSSFPSDYSTLPQISFVIPNLNNDMHDGTVPQGDTWLQQHLAGYVQWLAAHNSVLLVTFDEDDRGSQNHIATIWVGPLVVPGQYNEPINHFNVLRTLEDAYGLPYAGASAQALPITDIWVPPSTPTPSFTATPSLTPTITRTPLPTQTPGGPTATPMPTVCPLVFADVPPGSTFYEFIRCLACRGIVSGYPCGGPGEPCPGPYFRPNNNVTRGQAAKIIVTAGGIADPVPSDQQTFEDVAPGSTFWIYIERLTGRSIIGGYACGGAGEPCVAPGNRPYFRPNANVTRGQITKIIAGVAGYTETPTGQTFEDIPPTQTFYLYIERIASRGIIGGYPCGGAGEPCVAPDNRPYFRPNNSATRGQISKIAANNFFPDCQTPLKPAAPRR